MAEIKKKSKPEESKNDTVCESSAPNRPNNKDAHPNIEMKKVEKRDKTKSASSEESKNDTICASNVSENHAPNGPNSEDTNPSMAKKKGKKKKKNKSASSNQQQVAENAKAENTLSAEERAAEKKYAKRVLNLRRRKIKKLRNAEAKQALNMTNAERNGKEGKTKKRKKNSDIQANKKKRIDPGCNQQIPTRMWALQRHKERSGAAAAAAVREEVVGTVREEVVGAVPLQQRILRSAEVSHMLLYPGERVCVRGRAQIRAIRGSVRINGYDVIPGNAHVPLYSPSCYSLLTIDACIESAFDLKSVNLTSLGSDKDDILTICEKMSDCNTVIIVELKKLHSNACDFVTSLSPYLAIFDDVIHSEDMVVTSGLSVVADKEVRKLEMPESFDRAADEVAASLKQAGHVIAAVCGGKNTGKSTLARYLLNRLLHQVARVAWLECDVGQTEMTPACCVSLSIVTTPLLGPPFTHQLKPEVCRFSGLASPADDPAAYMVLVEQTYKHYLQHCGHVPLVVNTMGWNKGIGLALLTDTLRLIKPTHVLQLRSESKSRNMPAMCPVLVAEGHGWTSTPTPSSEPLSHFSHIQLQSAVDHSRELRDRFTPTDFRNLALLAYFSPLYDHNTPVPCPFQTVRPYKVAWSDVAVHVCSSPVPYDQVMYALNCSVVALCHADREQMQEPDCEGNPKHFLNTPDAQCLGFGVVRGIDPVEKVFYIVTPMPLPQLARVNTLLHGAIPLPNQLLTAQESASGEVPYMGYTLDTLGASSIKPRRHLMRPTPHKPS